MKKKGFYLLLCFLIFSATPLFSSAKPEIFRTIPEESRGNVPLSDPDLEEKARALFRQIRCAVCQGQSIDESESAFAQGVRQVIRTQIAQGMSEAHILQELTARFGENILLKPRFVPRNFALWFALPFCLLFGGGIAIVVIRKSRPGH